MENIQEISEDQKEYILSLVYTAHDARIIAEDIYLINDGLGDQILFKLSTKEKSPWFKSCLKITSEVYLLKGIQGKKYQGEADKVMFEFSDMIESSAFVSYSKITEDIYLLEGLDTVYCQGDADKVMLELSDMKESSRFKSYTKINDDFYHLKGLFDEDEDGDNAFLRITDLEESELMHIESCREITKDLYLVNSSNDIKFFFRKPDMKALSWFTSYLEINKNFYFLICHYGYKHFFRLSDMEESEGVKFDSYEVIGEKIYAVTESGSKAELDQETLKIGPFI